MLFIMQTCQLHPLAPSKKEKKDYFISLPVDDQENKKALMSNILVILSLYGIKVFGIRSLRNTNYPGNTSGDTGYVLIVN